MSLPLTGVRILDLSNVLAGPFCGYNLARLGAEVVKIENPKDGDLARRLGADPAMAERLYGLSFVAANACKQSVAIDLKAPQGRDIFLRLVEDADVVLENFRPGVTARLGLDAATLQARNPRLIYCAISGFGQNGPWARRPAYDQIIQGLSGAMSVTGDAQSAPLRAGFPISDTIAGLTAAFAISAALVDQRTTGRGRVIDVSLLESTLAAMGWVVSNFLNGGVAPQAMGNDNFTAAPSGAFRTASGLLNISANEQAQFEKLCALIGRPEIARDPRFRERQARKTNRAALTIVLESALAARSATEWENMFNAAGVPAGRVLSVPEALGADHLAARGFVEPLPDGLRVTRPGFTLDAPYPAPSAPPALGAHTRDWLARIGLDENAIETLAKDAVVRLAD